MAVCVADAERQHGEIWSGRDKLAELVHEFLTAILRQKNQAGIGAELPRSKRHRSVQARSDISCSFRQRAWKNKDRIHTAHLGVKGNWLSSTRSCLQQGETAGARAGESSSLDQGMLNQLRSFSVSRSEQHRENSFGQFTVTHSFAHS